MDIQIQVNDLVDSNKRKNPLSITHPDLAKEWDCICNAPLTPDDVTSGSGKKVFWICSKGHSFEASVAHRTQGTSCPCCSGQKVLMGFNDLLSLNPDIASQWNYKKNSGLVDRNGRDISMPEYVSPRSGQKVWWKCDKGHDWQAAVYSRVAGNGCPYCAGNKVLFGFNDLQTKYPELVREWCNEKNDKLSPSDVLPGSHRKVWWKCSKGHVYQAAIAERTGTRSTGCPYCSGKKVLAGYNDLMTTNPEIAIEWDTEKNYPLTPKAVSAGSSRKVWWKCLLGHEWETSVSQRTSGHGCPYCSGLYVITGQTDLLSTNPKLASEWNYEKNYPLTPKDVKQGANKRVWWKCNKGHEWQAVINSRSSSDLGCPICSNRKIVVGINDLITTAPVLAREWNYERNEGLNPTDYGCGSSKRVWWICEKGHEWQSTIVDRNNGNGCPFCSSMGSSMPEQGIAFYLSQHCEIEQRRRINKQEVDIYLPFYSIGIEYDGSYYHKNIDRDMKKDRSLHKAGLTLIRVRESDSNEVTEKKYICFVPDNMGKNYEWALRELFKLLSDLTGNSSFISINVDIKRDRLKIRERFNLVQKENSLESKYPDLAKQWNYEKNGILKPDMFSFGSDEKLWWKCDYGHEWQATISARTQGRGCPVCNSRTIVSGVNDLATLNPLLAKEWCYERNEGITPEKIALNARLEAWWQCPNCGGKYKSWVYNRIKGIGCPYCSIPAKRVLKGYNDLATKNPELLSEWHFERNIDIAPDEILPGSNLKVWWICQEGHEWEASIAHRVNGRGCPYCSGRKVLIGYNDLQTLEPDLAKEWNYSKNSGLLPSEVTIGSNKKVWWKCEYSHEWQAVVVNRCKGAGCPICARNRQSRKIVNMDTNELFMSVNEASNTSGVNASSISMCCSGKLKTAGGYHWKYADNI